MGLEAIRICCELISTCLEAMLMGLDVIATYCVAI